jgi:hypothetical protein
VVHTRQPWRPDLGSRAMSSWVVRNHRDDLAIADDLVLALVGARVTALLCCGRNLKKAKPCMTGQLDG